MSVITPVIQRWIDEGRRDPGDITTIEDEGSVDETRQLQMKAEIKSV